MSAYPVTVVGYGMGVIVNGVVFAAEKTVTDAFAPEDACETW